jgi:hypothetical protein
MKKPKAIINEKILTIFVNTKDVKPFWLIIGNRTVMAKSLKELLKRAYEFVSRESISEELKGKTWITRHEHGPVSYYKK